MTLAEKIAALRGERKLSQGDLAEKLDVSRQSVSKWETGQAVPELDKIIKLADLFGVSVDELVREEAELPQEEPPADSAPETPRTAGPQPQIIYVEQRGLTALQKTGIVTLVMGALMLFCIQFNVYIPMFGAPLIILSLPLIFAKKHPWLIDGWLLCLGSCLILSPYTGAAPWGLWGGLRHLHAYLTIPAAHYSTLLLSAMIGIVRGILFLVLVFFTARLFFRARAARKQAAAEETA